MKFKLAFAYQLFEKNNLKMDKGSVRNFFQGRHMDGQHAH